MYAFGSFHILHPTAYIESACNNRVPIYKLKQCDKSLYLLLHLFAEGIVCGRSKNAMPSFSHFIFKSLQMQLTFSFFHFFILNNCVGKIYFHFYDYVLRLLLILITG